MEQIQKRVHAIAEDVARRRLEDAENALRALGFTEQPGPCGCEIAEIAYSEGGSTIFPTDRPLYLKPCRRHRAELSLPSLHQLAGPLSDYMPSPLIR
jgi:hypothetical protein